MDNQHRPWVAVLCRRVQSAEVACVPSSNGDCVRDRQVHTHDPCVARLRLRKSAPVAELGTAHLGEVCILVGKIII